MAKRTKLQKATTIQSRAAREAIAAAADELERYAADGQVAGLVSKLRATIEGDVVPIDGTGLATAMLDGQVTTRYATSTSKADEKFAAELAAATVAVEKMDPSDYAARAAARERLAKLQKQYLENHSAGYARAEEMRKVDRGDAPAPGGAVAEKAARILKEDPAIGYDKLRERFSREEQAAYLASVRGAA